MKRKHWLKVEESVFVVNIKEEEGVDGAEKIEK